MSLNWREIDLILSELDLPGSFVQRIVQPDFSSLMLCLYRPHDPVDLYISLASGKTRLHRLSARPRSPAKLQRFAQLLRSRCGGGRIREAYQVHGDRIVKLVVTSGGETTMLWLRLWGGAANIIATDEAGTIIDAFYRRPARGEVSGGSFNPESLPAQGAGKPGYEVRDLPGEGDFNTRVEAYYRDGGAPTDLEKRRAEAITAIDRRLTRTRTTLENLERKRKGFESAERYKELGDLIMSNLHAVREGERWLRVESYYDANETIEIELDPTMRPEENAEAYYERYKKAKSGRGKLADEVAELAEEAAKLEEQRRRAESSDDPSLLRKLAGGRKQGSERKPETPGPGLRFRSGAHRILVGRSARENDELLRRHVRGNDLWLHSRDYPGAYVFIRQVPGKSVPLEVLLDAGNLALHYSKARSSGQAELYYTHVKYLRRPKEGKKGLVLPTQEKNLLVRHDPKRLERLFRDREEAELGL